ncbi:helix-turn-helix domain-containing protein [Bacteroides xylanisolvens]|uniref:helix-turn-helix domain-containing protein n=1 Tax=Bacteroides xylanisolvens TaxID=371601 RepID=UPI001C37B385|nr:helix-turn-helix domain-containing protein [Bacteroides xylanisolvens]MBV3831181.1 helix-turn-helix domain-containing protein [Bacteroides xylanisolvens]MBV3874227.1 helix-turn-helix domain-containing protein [Bacteroides xylanisolvens]MBV3879506.1 helix-turn-helix domain-containing protein [Bacteroides xylanisolvens]MBV3905450.1 helix-turn-helix domain-containing protein [Bacteroides xylanisolvens]MBV3910960.1 helix-turn-helix domain-containing protein [Bacteroides xylanisolvens]
MINTMKIRLILSFVLLIYSLVCQADGGKDTYIFRKVDYQQGLSNSAVLCLFQDNRGLMWFGTYDGVNCYDGRNMEVFRSDFSAQKSLSNNVIHSIQQADNNCLWISTHLGINRLSLDSRQVVGYYDFTDDYYLHSNSKGNTWVVSRDGIFYYNTSYKRFVKINNLKVSVEDMDKRAFVTDDGVLWIFIQHTGELLQVSQDAFDCDTLSIYSTVSSTDFHANPIMDVFYQNGVLCFIDSEHDLYVYDISRQSKIYIRNLSSLVQKYGTIAGIALFYEDIIIGFRTNGLVRLRTSQKYKEEVVDRNVRIYSIYRDPHQNVLWVASDGQGAIMYAKKYSIATNLMLNQLSSNLSRQVRSVMTDNRGGLWFGTKGDGLLHIPDYRESEEASAVTVYSPEGKQNVMSYMRWNKEFPVYKLVQSRYMDGFWIGSGDPGLFYYSFADQALHCVENLPAQPTEIHGIDEENDSVLYVVTAGSGFHKLILEKQAGTIRLKSQKSYHFFHGQREITMFYPMLAEGDSILWLGSREKGLIRFDKRTEEYKVISLKEMLHKSVDDVLSLYRTKEGVLYVGTTSGLVCLNSNRGQMKATYIGREQGLLNDMIHGVLEDENGLLWLGTNRGLIKYNPINGSSHAYFYSAGVQIGEFSDDAYYMCPYTRELFFGGIDGLLYLDKEMQAAPEFYPDILLRKLTIGHTQVVQENYYTDDGKALQFKGAEVSFTLSFIVPDFLSGEDIEYSYQLEGYDKDWTSFSSINEASYTGVPAGDYLFKVRYKRDVFDTEYRHFSIPVHILSPWYRSAPAYFIYFIIFLLLLGYVIYLLRKNYLQERMMKTLMGTERCRKSETAYTDRRVLEDFTLIYNYCDQLRAENLSYEQSLEKVSLIRETVMTALLNPDTLHLEELKQFFPDRFIVSARMSIQGVSQEVLRTLEEQGIDHSSITSAIPEHITFPVYKNALYSILYCCYLRIAEMKGTYGVIVDMSEQDGKMQLHFSSKDVTVKALYEYLSDKASSVAEKDADYVFGVHLLLGFVRSALERIHAVLRYDHDESGSRLTIVFEPALLPVTGEQGKKTVLLLEDRDEMTWLISNFLADEYVVHQVKSVQLAFEEIRRSAPALLLVDMTMYANAESTFMEYVSRNRTLLSRTAFIPLLTWKVSSAIQRELILWSDSYVVLPYDILFLREVVHNAIYGKREAKQIYMEELGDLAGQIVCTTTEQADFIRKLLKVIEENLDKEELGSTLIADRMAMSSRQFYRKFKEISNTAPGDLIKSYRMEKAARLLLDEELSIQDVIMEVGISSRSYFYKEFTRRFGMTPKDYREQRNVR